MKVLRLLCAFVAVLLLCAACAAQETAPVPSWDATQCNAPPLDSLIAEVSARPEPKKRVLVTGAAGFIGSHVAEVCATRLGFHVVAVDDLSGGFMRNVPSKTTFVKVDLQVLSAVEQLFAEHGPFDYVYHLAAYAAEGLSHFIRGFNYRNNLQATVQLINQAVMGGVKCFVFTSSIASFGSPKFLPMIEETPQHPEDPYGIAKLAAELDLKAAKEMFGMDFVVFRPHNVYGPRQNIADKFRNAIGIFMNQVLHDLPMTIFGDGKQTRGFSYIDDVAPVISVAPEVPKARNQAFFVGTDGQTSVYDLSILVARAMEVPHRVQLLDKRNEVMDATASHRKLRCFFNPPSPVALEDGINRTANYVKSKGRFHPTGFEKIEIWDRMPKSWVSALKEWKNVVPILSISISIDPNGALINLLRSIDFPVNRILVQVGNVNTTTINRIMHSIHATVEEAPKYLKSKIELKRLHVYPGVAHGFNLGLHGMMNSEAEWALVVRPGTVFESGALKQLASQMAQHVRENPMKFGIGFSEDESSRWGCFAMTRRLVSKVGYFDENFYPSGKETADMANRIRLSGFQSLPLRHVRTIRASDVDDIAGIDMIEASKRAGAEGGAAAEYYARKWGAAIECPDMSSPACTTYRAPFNDDAKSLRDWKIEPHRRAWILSGKGNLAEAVKRDEEAGGAYADLGIGW